IGRRRPRVAAVGAAGDAVDAHIHQRHVLLRRHGEAGWPNGLEAWHEGPCLASVRRAERALVVAALARTREHRARRLLVDGESRHAVTLQAELAPRRFGASSLAAGAAGAAGACEAARSRA